MSNMPFQERVDTIKEIVTAFTNSLVPSAGEAGVRLQALADLALCGIMTEEQQVEFIRQARARLLLPVDRKHVRQEDVDNLLPAPYPGLSIEIFTTTNESGSVSIRCPVMQCEFAVKPENVKSSVVSLVGEYVDLVEAGEISSYRAAVSAQADLPLPQRPRG
jgi:hypothetical protein